MKKLFGLILFAVPVSAQTDTAFVRRIFELEAKVAQLQLMVGVQGFNSPQIPCDSMEARRPSTWFINGEYNLAYRNRQFGCAFDPLVQRVTALEARPTASTDGLQTQITGLAARVASIESSVAGGQPVGTAVFDKIWAKKICIDHDCDPDWNAQLQIRGDGLANIGLEANLAHIDPQDPSHTHVSQINVSTDGGTRIQQNNKSTFSRGYISYVNPCRESLNFGPDSRSSISIYVAGVNEQTCTPIPHDRAQDFVFMVDEARRRSRIVMTRPNWQLEWVYSSAIYAADVVVPQPPPQQ
jgi:hypothetical protein